MNDHLRADASSIDSSEQLSPHMSESLSHTSHDRAYADIQAISLPYHPGNILPERKQTLTLAAPGAHSPPRNIDTTSGRGRMTVPLRVHVPGSPVELLRRESFVSICLCSRCHNCSLEVDARAGNGSSEQCERRQQSHGSVLARHTRAVPGVPPLPRLRATVPSRRTHPLCDSLHSTSSTSSVQPEPNPLSRLPHARNISDPQLLAVRSSALVSLASSFSQPPRQFWFRVSSSLSLRSAVPPTLTITKIRSTLNL